MARLIRTRDPVKAIVCEDGGRDRGKGKLLAHPRGIEQRLMRRVSNFLGAALGFGLEHGKPTLAVCRRYARDPPVAVALQAICLGADQRRANDQRVFEYELSNGIQVAGGF